MTNALFRSWHALIPHPFRIHEKFLPISVVFPVNSSCILPQFPDTDKLKIKFQMKRIPHSVYLKETNGRILSLHTVLPKIILCLSEMSRLVPKHTTCLAQLVVAGILFHMVGSPAFLPPALTSLADRHIVLPPSSGHTNRTKRWPYFVDNLLHIVWTLFRTKWKL